MLKILIFILFIQLTWTNDELLKIIDQEINEIIETGMDTKEFKAHPVSNDLYKRGIDTNQPYIIQPIAKDTLF